MKTYIVITLSLAVVRDPVVLKKIEFKQVVKKPTGLMGVGCCNKISSTDAHR